MLQRHRLLGLAALLLLGTTGCQEDNEKMVTGVNKPGVAPTNGPKSQEEYYKQQQKNNPYAAGGGYPGSSKR